MRTRSLLGLLAIAGILGGTVGAVQTGGGIAGDAAVVRVLRFEARAVDGVDVLILRGTDVAVEHREWKPIEGVTTEVFAAVPRTGRFRVEVREKAGRPRVAVIEQPSEANGFEVRVLIDDGPAAGDAPLRFELWAVPANAAQVAPGVPNPRNIVLVTIDSLRADRLSCYGYGRKTSPNLDRLAVDCVRFEHAFSTSSFTPPTHASILTSRYVGDHGLLTWNPLPEEQLTLAEILAARGYRTGATVNLGLLGEQNLGQGFAWQREGNRDGREVVSDALEFLRVRDDRPFFLWLHLYDVHRPYGRVPGWTHYFGAAGRAGVGDRESHYNLTPDAVRKEGLSEQDLAFLCDRYDAGIAYADAQLAALFAELSSAKRLADTVLIVTADHGESLLDHDARRFSHDPFLFSVVTRIPLLVRFPGRSGAGRTSDALVSQIDIAPTVLDLLGVEAPPTFLGVSLAAAQRGEVPARSHVFHECWGWEERKAIRTSQWLVIHDRETGATDAYDLRDDPGELQPRPDRQGVPDDLLRHLEGFTRRKVGMDTPPDLSDDTVRRLRELGYIR